MTNKITKLVSHVPSWMFLPVTQSITQTTTDIKPMLIPNISKFTQVQRAFYSNNQKQKQASALQ